MGRNRKITMHCDPSRSHIRHTSRPIKKQIHQRRSQRVRMRIIPSERRQKRKLDGKRGQTWVESLCVRYFRRANLHCTVHRKNARGSRSRSCGRYECKGYDRPQWSRDNAIEDFGEFHHWLRKLATQGRSTSTRTWAIAQIPDRYGESTRRSELSEVSNTL